MKEELEDSTGKSELTLLAGIIGLSSLFAYAIYFSVTGCLGMATILG